LANQEFNQKLAIKVSVNAGGSIITGVLDVGKPMFEIFGLSIEITFSMNELDFGNNVVITRNVYELVYGDTFTMKESESMNVNGANLQIYLAYR
jgi:hypothetical protein